MKGLSIVIGILSLIIGLASLAYSANVLQTAPTAASVPVWQTGVNPPTQWESIGDPGRTQLWSPYGNAEPTGFSIAVQDLNGAPRTVLLQHEIVCDGKIIGSGTQSFVTAGGASPNWAWYTFTFPYADNDPDFANGASCRFEVLATTNVNWGKSAIAPSLTIWGEFITTPPSQSGTGTADGGTSEGVIEGTQEEPCTPPLVADDVGECVPATAGPDTLQLVLLAGSIILILFAIVMLLGGLFR